ncbi:calsyntenin-1 isoform X2 [Cylas formicarius]|uniref:calsyntenin-1 isoform X2 n=1 Tax=Cylas formicarius TaxID=197179 RepID=UPI00295848B2|nr:calsyntenin-1 isoform X2 [Cylas formicarius]
MSLVRVLCVLVIGYCVAASESEEYTSGTAGTASSSVDFYDLEAPRLDISNLENGYHGIVKENETVVEVTPPIRAVGSEVCRFHIVNKHHGEAPFDIELREDGHAELRAKRSLNCEKRKNYKFDIAAVGCNGKQSVSATVHITVADVNEYPPTFTEPSYVRQVDEGRIYNEIVRVEATDRDCTPKFGDVCKYEILTSDQPFVIDMDGVIRNTEPLDYERSHNHILSVIAYDCGMRQSFPALVTIKVNRVCRLGWRGLPERVDYAPMTGKQELFPSANLELCDVPCNVRELRTRVDLATRHIGKGCDRDTYSVQSQRKLCGASPSAIDLLPSPGAGAEWTKPLISDEGHESDQMFEFDGSSTAVSIPNAVLDHNLPPTFTIATWMRHGEHNGQDKHMKEHILCSADDHKMNRHHYALFVRNCRLILLLRRDFSEGDLNIFRPAEWRWKISQVCDDQWHHYAINVRFPDVELYIDGQLFRGEKKNPEVIDDWPLHPTKGINTTLTVGACWQGSDNKMKHHLKGYLAGLSVLVKENEKPEVLSCLHQCKESLQVPGMELLQPGMELLTNSDLTEVTVEGDNRTNLEILVRKIGYANTREFPTPGRRNLRLTTTVTCDNGKAIKVPDAQTYVMVLRPQTPSINLNGTGNMARKYEDFRMGVRVLADIHITGEQKLDKCQLTIYPNLNPDHENLNVPEELLKRFGMAARVSKDGVTVSGSDMVFNYQQVLRQIVYTNRKPAYYLNRVFKLTCSELNGRFTSNEYVQTLTVIHPQPKESIVAHAKVNKHNVEVRPASVVSHDYVQATRLNLMATGGSHAVTIIVVVCVGFLLFMIVLGIIRIRAAHQRTTSEEAQDSEMTWDDSALTITVNPMENAEGKLARNAGCRSGDYSESEQSDSETSSDEEGPVEGRCRIRADSSDEDEDEEAMPPSSRRKRDYQNVSQLEWDNSTM